jgi:hypothetical protein
MEVAMPITFRDREQAFEAKFVHDEEVRFLAVARRDKMFARWAANRLSLSNEASEALAKDVLAIPDGLAHDRALLRQMADFLSAHGAGVPERDLSAVLGDCGTRSLRQLTETPAAHSNAV